MRSLHIFLQIYFILLATVSHANPVNIPTLDTREAHEYRALPAGVKPAVVQRRHSDTKKKLPVVCGVSEASDSALCKLLKGCCPPPPCVVAGEPCEINDPGRCCSRTCGIINNEPGKYYCYA
ncbi:hypothetical protein HOY80DRAFT_423585 [Tuber brumale]|nr:hypothetical protein HOY80DRAFT_423585 [Tuber brumale]